jgi:HK97 family phage prohead protease
LGRDKRQTRSTVTELKTRAEGDTSDMFIEGYFAVYSKPTELWPGAFEEIAPGTFDRTLASDIRGLINHDTTFVLGRNKAGTLELKSDSYGLWARIKINPADSDAVNLYERVKRGDVDQCSFGFNIVAEEIEWRDDGTVKWTITDVDLFEVSVCTFPAYEETGVQARKAEVTDHKDRDREQKRHNMKERLKACSNN